MQRAALLRGAPRQSQAGEVYMTKIELWHTEELPGAFNDLWKEFRESRHMQIPIHPQLATVQLSTT